MAFSRPAAVVVSLLLLALFAAFASSFLTVQAAAESTARGIRTSLIDCGSACGGRCRLSSRPNLCKRACGTCCARCGCVPPGTYGNKQVCPCYNNMKTRGGKPKCP